MKSIQTEKWNAEEENMKQGKQNRKNYKTTNNRKTWIKKKNKQENNIKYYFMLYRPGNDHFLKILLCLYYAGRKEPQILWTLLLSRAGQPDFQFRQKFRFSFRYQDWNTSGTRTATLSLGNHEACANGCSGQGVKLSTDFHLVPNLKTDGAGCKHYFHVVFRQKVNFRLPSG